MKKTLNKRKMMLTLAIVATITFFIGFVIIATKVFYPFHVITGFSIMLISVITFIYNINKYFKILKNLESLTIPQTFFLEYKTTIYIVLIIIFLIIIYATLVPFRNNPFKNLSPSEINNIVEEDLNSATIILDHLEITGNELLESNLLNKIQFTVEEREKLKNLWKNFLTSVYESEHMSSKHSYFHFISIISQPEEHAKSFTIAYSLYTKKLEIISKIITEVQGNISAKKILNENIKKLHINNLYYEISENYYHPRTILRLNLGQAYLNTLIDKVYGKKIKNERYKILLSSAKKDYESMKNRLGKTIINSGKVGSGAIEKNIFTLWFPIQKNVAKALGHTYLSKRKNKFITIKQIEEMKKVMEPGDIMLQRRNWYMSNIGIPGFWAHAALYTGTLEDMDEYFSTEFPYQNYTSMSEYLKNKLPKVYSAFNKDSNNFKQSVIEGKEPGIILRPLEESARADYNVTLRPKLNKKDKLLSLIRAFENFGKPYDFDFDFGTRDSMVCSELVYDAYQKTSDKNGINFPLSSFNGRTIMAPVDIAKKFKNEHNTEKADLEFVYFLDGNENTKTAMSKDVKAFIDTVNRPKYSFQLD